MSTQQEKMMAGGAVSIGSDRVEDQDPRPEADEPWDDDDTLVNIKQPDHRPAPASEPVKDAPSFPPGSPENLPPGPTSS